MTDNEIDALLAGMKQFEPLKVGRTAGSHRSFVTVDGPLGLEANCGVDGERNRAKADFFVAAPAIVRQLRERNKHLEAEVSEWRVNSETGQALKQAMDQCASERERRTFAQEGCRKLSAECDGLRERVTQLAGECVCGHDGKLTSEDCGVHRETANVGNLVRQNDALRERVAQQEQEIARLTSEIKEPRCNECGAVLGDNWCADCAGKADREKMAQQEREIERLKECVRIIR